MVQRAADIGLHLGCDWLGEEPGGGGLQVIACALQDAVTADVEKTNMARGRLDLTGDGQAVRQGFGMEPGHIDHGNGAEISGQGGLLKRLTRYYANTLS